MSPSGGTATRSLDTELGGAGRRRDRELEIVRLDAEGSVEGAAALDRVARSYPRQAGRAALARSPPDAGRPC
jgi:hypothetical protein